MPFFFYYYSRAHEGSRLFELFELGRQAPEKKPDIILTFENYQKHHFSEQTCSCCIILAYLSEYYD